MNNIQIKLAIADLRDLYNEMYNEHAALKEQVRELRIKAGIENPACLPFPPATTLKPCETT